MTQDVWLTGHPYLLSVAEFHAQVEQAVVSVPAALACIPDWPDYEPDYLGGVPLLRSGRSAIDLSPVGITLGALIGQLGSARLPDKLAQEIRDLQLAWGQDPAFSQRAVATLLDPVASESTHLGILRCLGWIVMSRYLSRIVVAFARWRNEECWLRRYCPTCGSLPAMAQLTGVDLARLRLLACGCCGTRWRYQRKGCPFCQNEDDFRLGILMLEGEEELRIDYCGSCSGYIKTYNGSGCESLMLADWTSLHLDIIARDQGLNRFATSLYLPYQV